MIKVHLLEQSKPIEYSVVVNTYTKGATYCVLFERDGVMIVHKYPLVCIFRIEESY